VNILLTVILVSLAIAAWLAVLKVFPSCSTSRLRYELWRMRDETVDEIYDDEIHNKEQARRFVRELERAIRAAPDLSILNLVVFSRIARGAEIPLADRIELSKLDDSDRKRLEPRYRAYEWVVFRHALTGSLSGWLVLIFLVAVALPQVLLHRLTRGLRGKGRSLRDETKWHVREEVEKVPLESALAVLSERKKDRELPTLV
jgi:hypothetical protein